MCIRKLRSFRSFIRLLILAGFLSVCSGASAQLEQVVYALDTTGDIWEIIPETHGANVIRNLSYSDPNGLAYAGNNQLLFWSTDNNDSANLIDYNLLTGTSRVVSSTGNAAAGLKTNGVWVGDGSSYYYVQDGTNKLVRLSVDFSNSADPVYTIASTKSIGGLGNDTYGDLAYDSTKNLVYGSAEDVDSGTNIFYSLDYTQASLNAVSISDMQQNQLAESNSGNLLYGCRIDTSSGQQPTQTEFYNINDANGTEQKQFIVHGVLTDMAFGNEVDTSEPSTLALAFPVAVPFCLLALRRRRSSRFTQPVVIATTESAVI